MEKKYSELSQEELVKLVEEKDQKIQELQKELDSTVLINKEFSAALASKDEQPKAEPVKEEKPVISDKTFELDGYIYGFKKLGVSHKNQVIGAEEVLADVELQKELVKMSSGLIFEKGPVDSEEE